MTPQLLIVKIQAVLAGRLDATQIQKRTLALEYCRMCAEAEEQLERCMALIKAGREYPALQVAESSSVLDSINDLVFVEIDQWRSLCDLEGLPLPPPFSDEQIKLLNSLYSKGITQAHPLYRDYRRAMRLRKYADALSIIRTISKINSYDNEARTEYNRLRKLITDKNLTKLHRALEDGDMPNLVRLCSELESQKDIVENNYIWREAVEKKKAYELERAKERCAQIVSEIKKLDIEKDIAAVSALTTEFNVLAGDFEPDASDSEFIETCNRKCAEYQDEQLAQENAARTRNKIVVELDGNSKTPKSKKLDVLKKLRGDIGARIDPDLKAKLDAEIASLSFKRNFSRMSKTLATVAVVAAIAGGGVYMYSKVDAAKKISQATVELAEIEELLDPNTVSERLGVFVKNYPNLVENPRFAGTIAKLRETVDSNKKRISRVESRIKELESVDLKTATSAQFENLRSGLDAVMSDVPNLPAGSRDEFADKGEAFSKRLSAAIDARRLARAKIMHASLSEYEALLSKYENFAEPREKLLAQEAKIKQALLPLLEDVSRLFKPAQTDVERYSDLAQRVSVAASTYARADEQYKNLLASRSTDSYFDGVKAIENSSIQTADFSKKLSKISVCESSIRAGQAADFADEKSAMLAINFPVLGKGTLRDNPLMTNVYRHSNAQKTYTYTLGELKSAKQNWSGGHEITQACDEIFPSGEVRKSKYLMSYVDGKPPRGELLVEGSISEESKAGKAAYETAETRSYLKAIEELAKSNANPIFKVVLEAKIFDKMNADKVGSGLAFSPSAQARSILVKNIRKSFNDHSWIFESQSKINFVNSELYEKPIPNFENEARINKRALEIAGMNPIVMVGVADASGKKVLFKESNGAVWAVGKNGKFMRFESGDSAEIAPLSPIFMEQKSSKDILKEASEGL